MRENLFSNMSKSILFLFLVVSSYCMTINAQQGYKLWMDYSKSAGGTKDDLKYLANSVFIEEGSDILQSAKNEINMGLSELLNQKLNFSDAMMKDNSLVVAKVSSLNEGWSLKLGLDSEKLGKEGFYIKTIDGSVLVTANTDIGLLYGVFRLLQSIQAGHDLKDFRMLDTPTVDLRMLNHWDNSPTSSPVVI